MKPTESLIPQVIESADISTSSRIRVVSSHKTLKNAVGGWKRAGGNKNGIFIIHEPPSRMYEERWMVAFNPAIGS